ncbi:MAG: RHS repeat-associated core domain-containing protein, partial [Chloroflexi bacterium]|nr:RHS repeat-associated core domain-containing protein [Chloroflexota bacterium]
GQRHDESIRLVQMGARWYDARIGRWISADTIVPQPQAPQEFNRYSYVQNAPLVLRDPTGHVACLDEECRLVVHPVAGEVMRGNTPPIEEFQQLVSFISDVPADSRVWSAFRHTVIQAVRRIGTRLGEVQGHGSAASFRRAYGNPTFRRIGGDPIDGWAETHLDWGAQYCGLGEICYDASFFGNPWRNMGSLEQNVVHELGHGLDQRGGRQARADLAAAAIEADGVRVAGGGWGTGYVRTSRGYYGWPWQQNPGASPGEDFADMYVGYISEHFRDDVFGAARHDWMQAGISRWTALAVSYD